MNNLKIQILMSTYNGAAYIDEQIQSILNQKQVYSHLLIRDDGSTDQTVELLEQYARLYPEQIKLHKGSNVGVVASFFTLLELAEEGYDYYAFCDQDDVWMPYKLSKAGATLLQLDSQIPLMYCSSTKMVTQDLTFLKVWPQQPRMPLTMHNALVENVAVGCTMVFNSRTIDLVRSYFPRNLENVIMHDWWIYVIASAMGQVVFDENAQILYRQHGHNVLGGQSDGWMTKWIKRARRFTSGKNHYILSKQAKEFKRCFGPLLSSKQQEDIQQLLDGLDKGLLHRMKYATQTPFYRQSKVDNMVYKMIYVLKKV